MTKKFIFTVHDCQPFCPRQRRDTFGQFVCVEEVKFDSPVTLFLFIFFTKNSQHSVSIQTGYSELNRRLYELSATI